MPLAPIWYPRPQPASLGPGHTKLAYTVSRHGCSLGEDIYEIVQSAESEGTKILLLSSEEFCCWDNQQLQHVRKLLHGDVHLVVTLRSVVDRIGSEWQELVKHGHTQALTNSGCTIFDRPGMQPDLVSRFIDALSPVATSVVFLRRGDPPELLFTRAMQAVGFSFPMVDSGTYLNSSIGFVEAETLRRFNEVFRAFQLQETNYFKMRDALLGAFGSKRWKESRSIPIALPAELVERGMVVGASARDTIKLLAARGLIQIIGDPDVLVE